MQAAHHPESTVGASKATQTQSTGFALIYHVYCHGSMLLWVSWLWAACLVLVLVSCEQSLYRLLLARQHVQARADSVCCASLMICNICDVISDLLH